jgi:hypothetical protein
MKLAAAPRAISVYSENDTSWFFVRGLTGKRKRPSRVKICVRKSLAKSLQAHEKPGHLPSESVMVEAAIQVSNLSEIGSGASQCKRFSFSESRRIGRVGFIDRSIQPTLHVFLLRICCS